MILDLIIAAIVFVWAVYGYRKGLIKQIFVLAGILAIVFCAAPMADLIEEILAKEFHIELVSKHVRGFLLAGCSAILYIVAYIVGHFLQATLVKGIPVAEKTNHILGTVLAVFASVIAVFFILCIFSIGKEKIKEYAPSAYDFISSSKCYQIAETNNPVQNFDFFSKITTPTSHQDSPADTQNSRSATETAEESSQTKPSNSKEQAETPTSESPIPPTPPTN